MAIQAAFKINAERHSQPILTDVETDIQQLDFIN